MPESTDMTGFGTAELGHATAMFIAQMDRAGTKVRRDEWEFGDYAGIRLGIRINYAHREQRIHLLADRREIDMVSCNLDSSDPEFPTLTQVLNMLKGIIVSRRVDSAIIRPGESTL